MQLICWYVTGTQHKELHRRVTSYGNSLKILQMWGMRVREPLLTCSYNYAFMIEKHLSTITNIEPLAYLWWSECERDPFNAQI